MATALKLGPADHGRKLSEEEFTSADYQEGYEYEVIDGKLSVSPQANYSQFSVERWLYLKFERFVEEHPEVANFAANEARVFVPNRAELTVPEPDIAVYHNFPVDRDPDEVRWEEYSPILVVEVLSPEDPDKDLIRNVDLYLQVPSIREYWVVDSRQGVRQMTMQVRRRHGRGWRIRYLKIGEHYTTRLLPGFELVLEYRK